MSEQNSQLWHDLGVNLFLQGFIQLKVTRGIKFSKIESDDFIKEGEFLKRSLATLKRSIALDSSNHNAWNTLGVVAYYKGIFTLISDGIYD